LRAFAYLTSVGSDVDFGDRGAWEVIGLLPRSDEGCTAMDMRTAAQLAESLNRR